jgi:hypothetical protein
MFAELCNGQFVLVPAGQPKLTNIYHREKDNEKIVLPFIDDFSNYEGNPTSSLWEQTGGVFINANYALYPPTVGVATFDALDNQGMLYSDANISSFNADTLTSLSIRLDSVFVPSARKLKVEDSVYLSFYLQPGGGYGQAWERLGVAPSKNDSLLLEFYDSDNDVWLWAWSTCGFTLDSLLNYDSNYFRYIIIPINEERYFNSDFRFRFRNFASLEQSTVYAFMGNCDQWNIDYVYINYNRRIKDSTRHDLAFVHKPVSILKKYHSMPARQFRSEEVADNLQTLIINLDSITLNTSYKFYINDSNNQIYFEDRGFENLTPFIRTKSYRNTSVNLFPVASLLSSIITPDEWKTFSIIHTVKAGVGQDNRSENDTIIFTQRFENFYAYDDGSAEYGIGVEGNPNSHLAVGFSLNEIDTLTAIDVYFNSTYKNANQKPFYLCVWDVENGLPKDTVYRSEQLTPHTDGLNIFNRYILTKPVIVNDKFFISIQSKTGDFLSIGFDQNNDAGNEILGKIGNTWTQNFFKGAAMIRPYFGYAATVSLNSNIKEPTTFNVFPNPTTQYVYIKTSNPVSVKEIALYNILGQKVYTSKFVDKIDISNMHRGIYILKISTNLNQIYQHKIIIK